MKAGGIKNIFGYVVIIVLCLYFVYVGYAILRSIIGDYYLKRSGICTKAVLYMETHGPHSGYHLGYRFFLDGKEYDGLMHEKAGLKIGDTVCVVYLQSHPGIHKEVGEIDFGTVKCDCK